MRKSNIKFISRKDRPKKVNKASKYANQMLKSESARYGSNLDNEYKKILNNRAVYLPNFFCKTRDYNIFNKIMEELGNNNDAGNDTGNDNIINWSKHKKYENPEFSETFNYIVNEMAKHFNVDVIQTRLNIYIDGRDWKPFHHDKHAYADQREDYTMGVSFGCTRELEFLHEESGNKFSFPQNNGDVFAFDTEINKSFMHGVPKSRKRVGKRISIIAWGQKL